MNLNKIESRALEPIATLFRRELHLPEIFIGLEWPPNNPGHSQVDLLAIDHAGSGDAHVVQIKERASDALVFIPKLLMVTAHYRWIAFFEKTVTPKLKSRILSKKDLYPSEG